MSHFIDARDAKKSNWLRYVNCAVSKDIQNISAIQFNDEIYYTVTKDIEPNTELFVWYGDAYAQQLGLVTLRFQQSLDLVRIGKFDLYLVGVRCKFRFFALYRS